MASLYELQQAGEQPRPSNPNHEAALKITEAHAAAVDKVRRNPTLSNEGKALAMAPLHVAAQAQMAAVQAKAQADTAARVTSLHRTAFGVPTDPISAMSYRDAQGRAAAVDDPSVADWQLQRSLQTGDDLQARALAQRSSEMGWSGPLSRYVEANPAAGAALAELAARNSGQVTQIMADSAHYWLPRPSELAHLQDHEIERLAAARDGS